MWKHFGFETKANDLGVEESIREKVVCSQCGKKLSFSGSTTSMISNWNKFHKSESDITKCSKEMQQVKRPVQCSIMESLGHKAPLSLKMRF